MDAGQLARRCKLPYRSSNAGAANAVDAQAAYESQMSIWGAVMGGANLVKHGAGWMEGGLVASYEKLVLDAEMLQMMAEFLQPLAVDDDTLGLDAIAEVGPGGHFFGAAHTLARYETAFYAPILSDWRNFETWREAGALDTAQRANALWKRLLAEYRPPPLDPAVDEAIARFREAGQSRIALPVRAVGNAVPWQHPRQVLHIVCELRESIVGPHHGPRLSPGRRPESMGHLSASRGANPRSPIAL